MSTCDPPVLPEPNGDLQQVEVEGQQLDYESNDEMITERVQFQVGEYPHLDHPTYPQIDHPGYSQFDHPPMHLEATGRDYEYPPWQPLQLQANSDLQVTRSCHQIQHLAIDTSTTVIRSASAGEILDSRHHQQEKATVTSEEEVKPTAKPHRRHFSDIRKPVLGEPTTKHHRRHFSDTRKPVLIWQASVDHLSAPPIGRRRRRTNEGIGRRTNCQSQQHHSHLGVRKLLVTLRRSFGDLFNVDDQQQQQQQQGTTSAFYVS